MLFIEGIRKELICRIRFGNIHWRVGASFPKRECCAVFALIVSDSANWLLQRSKQKKEIL